GGMAGRGPAAAAFIARPRRGPRALPAGAGGARQFRVRRHAPAPALAMAAVARTAHRGPTAAGARLPGLRPTGEAGAVQRRTGLAAGGRAHAPPPRRR